MKTKHLFLMGISAALLLAGSISNVGLNMDKVASLSLGGNAITTFVEQYSTRLTFVSPIVADGDYVLTGITSDGESVNFFVEDEIKTELAVTVKDSPSEVELWKGHYYVSWEAGASESAKEFGEVKTMIQDLPLGSKLKIYYTIEPNDTYHQIGTKTAYWTDLPGYPESVFSEDGVVEIVLTQEIIDLLKAEAGFICVGHGYYVDRVAYEE